MTAPRFVPAESSYQFARVTLPVPEAKAQGRDLRRTLPRRSHAHFVAPDRDPIAILEDQNRDRLPELVPIRIGRMLESPFTYYRGTAAVMAHDLASEDRTGVDLVVCGDAHVSNFGLFASPERQVLFDLNDFDEASFGPWEWDVKRLAASAVIGGRSLGFTRDECTTAAMDAVEAYRDALQTLFTLNALERFYYHVSTEWLEEEAHEHDVKILRRTVKKAQRRTSERVMMNITTSDEGGDPRIIDEFPVIRHDEAIPVRQMVEIYDAYRRTVRSDVALLLEQFRVVDAVRRIVGVGSVGTRCSIVLLLGPSDEPLFLQVKEAPPSVIETYGRISMSATRGADDNKESREGWRVVTGQRILQASSDPFLGWIAVDGRDFYIRQFRDMKGSIELEELSAAQFARYAELCGAVLGRAHAQSPRAAIVSGYLGRGSRFDEAITAWAHSYADQVERDYAALERAVREGRLPAETEL